MLNETNRIEAFSDGVFAIAITLLVLDLRSPEASEHGHILATQLLHHWPNYVAFLTSFAFIGVMWINHHRLFTMIHRSDDVLLLLNGLLLLGVTVIPFPSSMLAAFLGKPDERIAALVYNGAYLFIAIFFNALWRYASFRHRLLDPKVDLEAVNAIHRSFAYGPIIHIINMVIVLINVDASLIVNATLAVFFAMPQKRIHARLADSKLPSA